MCASSKQSTPPVAWSSLQEHVIKATAYGLFLVHAVKSAQYSSTFFSCTINSLIGLFFARLVWGEANFALRRATRRLPPGHLDYPIQRAYKLISMVANEKFDMKGILGQSIEKYGTMFSTYFLNRVVISMGGHDDLNWVFQNDRKAITEVSWPPNTQMLLGPGAVANQTGKYHRTLRRLLEPYFAPAFVRNYFRPIDETTVDMLQSWSEGGGFHSSNVFKMYALRIFYAASFGRVDEAVIQSIHDDFTVWAAGALSLTGTVRVPGMSFDKAMRARERLLVTFDRLIDQFKEESPEDSERAKTTVMGRLIYGRDRDDNRMLTREEAKDNMLVLIFAGHDTTYASISTLLHHLTQNPDAMEALREEVSTFEEPLTPEALRDAPVLNACLHESWRCDPPVIGGFREVLKDCWYKGYSFERGSIFFYSTISATIDEGVYRDHRRFNIGRFLPRDHKLYRPEDDSGVDPLQVRANYPIFGGGTHVCLGKAFAMLEMRVLVARLVGVYDVEVRNEKKLNFPFFGWSNEFKLKKKKVV